MVTRLSHVLSHFLDLVELFKELVRQLASLKDFIGCVGANLLQLYL